MPKQGPAISVGFDCAPDILAAIKKLESLPGTRSLGFMADEGNERLWLVIGCDDKDVWLAVNEIGNEGGLRVSDHGTWSRKEAP